MNFMLFRAAVVNVPSISVGTLVMFCLDFGSYHHAALATAEKAGKGFGDPVRLIWFQAASEDSLDLIKQFLCNEWLVDSFVDFPGIPEVAVVERIRQHLLHLVLEQLSIAGLYAVLRQKVGHGFKRIFSCSKQRKELTDDWCFLPVNHNSFRPYVIYIANRSHAGILPASHFLAQPPLSIFREGIHEVLALPKGDLEHKLALRCRLKPELGKLERYNHACINEIDNLATVHAVARKSIRVPSQDAGSFMVFNSLHHRIEHRPPRYLSRLFLDKLLDDKQRLSFSKLPQFR